MSQTIPGQSLPSPSAIQVSGHSRSQQYRDVYANQIRLGMTYFDFTAIFGTTEDYGPGNMGTQDQVSVRMAPGTLKQLCFALQSAIAAYEEAVGPIPFPDALREDAETNRERLSRMMKDIVSGQGQTSSSDAPIGAPTASPPPSEQSPPGAPA